MRNSDNTHIKKLRSYLHRHTDFPSFRELAQLLGFGSLNSVSVFLQRLERSGYIEKQGRKYRATNLLKSYVLYDSVRAGFPTPGSEENVDNITIDAYLIENPNTTVLVKVSGNSMQDAGILEGDIVVVEKGRKEKIGDVIIAQVDGDYTLKFLEKDSQGLYLRPGNKQYPNIRADEELRVFGVVTGSIRKMVR